jgi:TetR/AcrR family transcriptional regulator, transcriptional repressor for nem operon
MSIGIQWGRCPDERAGDVEPGACVVARYGKEHKDATRRRIIETAGRRFKQDGIDGAGIATLMADAGLTNGAFYAHFESKDDLVATVVGDQLSRQATTFAQLPAGRAGLEDFVRVYLSRDHRDHRDVGCPSAALLDEIGRCTESTRKAYTKGAKAILDEICTRLAPEDPRSARGTAFTLYAMLVGTMQLARAVADPKLSKAVLDEGIETAVALIAATGNQ